MKKNKNDILREYGVTKKIEDKDQELPLVNELKRDNSLPGRLPKNFYLYDNEQISLLDKKEYKKLIRKFRDSADDYKLITGKSYLSKSRFGELIAELRNNSKCSYSTYLNDLITEDNYFPRYVSVLVKQRLDQKYADVEVIVSRILNEFGCPTVFNSLQKTEEEIELSRYSNGNKEKITQYNIFSVDFMKENEEFVSLGDIGMGRGFTFQSLESWDKFSTTCLTRFLPKISEDNILSFRRDLYKTYVCRLLLLGDVDLDAYNQGLCYNKNTQECRLSPSHDFEFCFSASLRDELMQALLNNAMIKYIKEFPADLKELMAQVSSARNNGKLYQIISTNTDKVYTKMYSDRLIDNIDIVLEKYKELTSKSYLKYSMDL